MDKIPKKNLTPTESAQSANTGLGATPKASRFPEGFKEVTSSQILAVAYFEEGTHRDVTGDPATLNREHKNGRLEIIFKGGTRYAYDNVLPYQVEAMLDPAQSTGKYFSENIRKHADLYPFVRMEDFVPTVEG